MVESLMDIRMETWIAEGVEGPIWEACRYILQDLVAANLLSTMKENTLCTQPALVDEGQSPEIPPSFSQVILPGTPIEYATLVHGDSFGGPSDSYDSESGHERREGGRRGKKHRKDKKSKRTGEEKKKSGKSLSTSSMSLDESDSDSSSGEDRRRRQLKRRI